MQLAPKALLALREWLGLLGRKDCREFKVRRGFKVFPGLKGFRVCRAYKGQSAPKGLPAPVGQLAPQLFAVCGRYRRSILLEIKC